MQPRTGPSLAQHPDGVQAGFFEVDGTLMDTDDQAVENLSTKLRFLGTDRAARLARRTVMATESPMNFAMTVLDMVGLDPLIFGLRRRLSRAVKPTFRLMTGVRPLIEHLARDKDLAVITTRSRQDALSFLAQHDLTDAFDLVVTQETTKRLKPHPEPVLYAARELSLSPTACAMVGDTTVDVRSARRAGAWAIAVLCGFGEERELRRAGAQAILPATADLLPLLTESPA